MGLVKEIMLKLILILVLFILEISLFTGLLLWIIFLIPRGKGALGERRVAKILTSLDKTQYVVLHNVLLKNKNSSTQIDHIIISVYGIFVIETKNYSGWILGSEYKESWTQSFCRYGKTYQYQFRNPIFQNNAHVKALQYRLYKFADLKIIPIIVFSNDCELKITVESDVIYFCNLKNFILQYTDEVLSVEQMHVISRHILEHSTKDKCAEKNHVQNVRLKELGNAAGLHYKPGASCPRCSGRLLERKGKYSNFLGCSNYPKCRYVYRP